MSSLTQKKLRKLLSYNPFSGELTWRKTLGSRAMENQLVSGSLSGEGYRRLRVLGELHQAHRLIWLHVYGRWPTGDIDHINRNRSDNRLSNLREASRTENMLNTGCSPKNTSGYKGVTYHKRSGKFMAQASLSGKNHYLGLHKTPEEASASYQCFAKANHGNFYFGDLNDL